MHYLEGVRILDLSRVLAGPLATQNLADMGASVLKVESPKGDDTRQWGPPFKNEMAAYFQSCNRSKASLVCDFRLKEDAAFLQQLVAVADVVIDNFTPSVRERWGLDANSLRRKHPHLITMSITGYSGKRCNEPGYDVMIQAESGLMGITGPREGAPHKVGVAVVDVLTGMMASNGILAALFRKERHGLGASLEVSLFQTALYSLVNVATNTLMSGKASQRWGNAHPNIVPYQPFETKDQTLVIGAGNMRQYQKLCDVLGITDPTIREATNQQRVARRAQILVAFQNAIKTFSASDLLIQLKAAGIPSAPILMPHEALAQASQWHSQSLIGFQHEDQTETKLVGSPLLGDGMRQTHTPPPALNQGGMELAQQWLQAEES